MSVPPKAIIQTPFGKQTAEVVEIQEDAIVCRLGVGAVWRFSTLDGHLQRVGPPVTVKAYAVDNLSEILAWAKPLGGAWKAPFATA